jgi:hypothetical protein
LHCIGAAATSTLEMSPLQRFGFSFSLAVSPEISRIQDKAINQLQHLLHTKLQSTDPDGPTFLIVLLSASYIRNPRSRIALREGYSRQNFVIFIEMEDLPYHEVDWWCALLSRVKRVRVPHILSNKFTHEFQCVMNEVANAVDQYVNYSLDSISSRQSSQIQLQDASVQNLLEAKQPVELAQATLLRTSLTMDSVKCSSPETCEFEKTSFRVAVRWTLNAEAEGNN